MSDPPGGKYQRARCWICRWILYGGGHDEVTNVIESHHHNHEPAEDVQRGHSVRPPIRGRGGCRFSRTDWRSRARRMDMAHGDTQVPTSAAVRPLVHHSYEKPQRAQPGSKCRALSLKFFRSWLWPLPFRVARSCRMQGKLRWWRGMFEQCRCWRGATREDKVRAQEPTFEAPMSPGWGARRQTRAPRRNRRFARR